jgi:hypothetical protein
MRVCVMCVWLDAQLKGLENLGKVLYVCMCVYVSVCGVCVACVV